ncbi:TIGR02680 family protein [Blastochloris sulfoviridis]|uniref:TIGR02680 family protein n=2 Tax=Blastochloris sulfoviridis TaxID=50712 RepID=A0A5M6I2L5_9HYPH|nr:TIGR02680 family protein [Blastochloris sulfoviridis]
MDGMTLSAAATERPALPMPARERWQPLRIGLVELFHYDSEEFWFRDGHLLLRGNNGTGKSKVLSLTLPFLLDAQLKPARIEPDGDSGKKMAWNLLMSSYDRRIGYAWIEFGRLAEDGTPRFLTLGAGLSAAAARPQVEAWFFILEDADGARLNRDLWLVNAQRVVLTKERLREQLLGRGQVFEAARDYRRAVDERLFRLGVRRYDALMDTLIQLRQPQLSKRPDETALSNALSEALPPLAPELLGDVAEALGQLEEDRRQLEEFQALAKAVEQFERRYRIYAGTQSRRQARVLRQAQSEFDNASRARNDAQARLERALADETRAGERHDEADAAFRRARARLDELRQDPAMKDAASLERAEQEASRRREALHSASAAASEAVRRLARAREDVARAEQRAEHGQRRLEDRRREAAADAAAAGLAAAHAENPVAASDVDALVALAPHGFDEAVAALATAARARREDIALLRRRRDEMERAEREHAERRRIRDERQFDADAAEERRAQADADVEAQGVNLVGAWERHLADLVQLAVEPDDGLGALAALAAWVTVMDGDNPARRLLQAAQQRAAERFAERAAALDGSRKTLEVETAALEDERRRLEAGTDPPPPPPYTRDPDARRVRSGAPLWQLVDFRERVSEAQRAGLEAALEAAGLLDAWVSPEGRVETGDGGTLLRDTQLMTRPGYPSSLADWLVPAGPPESGVPADIVAGILSGIACTDDDVIEAEAWVAPDGRFRLGTLAGAWTKPAAIHVGHTARAAARARRLADIAVRLTQIADERAVLQAMAAEIASDRSRADDEWRRSPTEDALRAAHLAAAAAAREAQLARVRLAEAEDRRGTAEQALKAARERLATDAADMRLPDSAEALMDVETALERYRDTLGQLAQAGHEVRLAAPELQRSRVREDEARADLEAGQERLGVARTEAEEASARFETLRSAIGAKVDDLKRQLAEATEAAKTSESALDDARTAQSSAREARAVAGEQARSAAETLQQKSDARGLAVARWQQFAATGLLAAAIPDLDLPDIGVPWTIDPALTLSRRVEQALSDLKDDDDAWSRVLKQLNEEFADLQRALGALGHQAVADVGDWGLVVYIVYQNRPERPDRLSARLADEIAQRGELLTAKEREVLENHLQAEIATGIQRLMQNAEAQRDAINGELYKRPTSTGVRFRLIWQTLDEEDGAPIGLDAARKRLLNTSADLWSAEDRAVVGAMLQRCILAERERADPIGGGSLLDQLSAALDYRRWHRFRIERWQDGQWRKLSGPASSGERALGLTVPLFAAVASFYGQGASAQAPRLILLDEAFAGIDDAARAHCMGLIHEFDLDFVLTSEREWACYAELPGVAICQLQRREGIDAVFVSRWTWDGRARRREADPDRRFAPA